MLLGIVGEKRHGKDTIGDYLVDKYGFVKVSFAHPLKMMVKELFNFSEEQINGDLKEEIDPRWNASPRKLLQIIGTDLFRNRMGDYFPNLKDNFWLIKAKNTIDDLRKINPDVNIVITDCRFPNEVEMIRSLGGKIIKVVRSSIKTTDTHESELYIRNMNDHDKLIKNDSTIDDLYCEINDFIKK